MPTDTPAPPTNTPEDPKAVSRVQLVSGQAGVIDVSWDTPSQAPKDYRVNWAKVGEGFPTWTDLSGNAFPTSNSYTITGLDHGARYKVRLRARYQSGGPGDWSARYEIDVAS